MHIWCKFGDSSSNPLQVVARTSQISSKSKSKWPKWPWRSRPMTSISKACQKYPMIHVWCKFSDSSPNLWRVIVQTSLIASNSELKWPKWPWRSMSMTSIFNTDWEYPMMHVWCKFGDSSSVTCYHIYIKFMVRKTDRHRQRQYPCGLKG